MNVPEQSIPRDVPPHAPLGRWQFPLAVCILMAALIMPFLQTKIPPVVDYTNHLARAYILAHVQGDPWLSRMYMPHWSIIPNLAIDLVWPSLLTMLSPLVAGQLVLVAALLAPLGGIIAFNRALFGRKSFWPLASAIVAFNFVFLLGLLNFLFGLGVAFVTAAIWVRWRERHTILTVLGVAVGSVVVFFCHIMALLLVAVLIGAYEIDYLLRHYRDTNVVMRATYMIIISIPTIVLYLCSSFSRSYIGITWRPLPIKIVFLFAPLANYYPIIDLISGLSLLVFTAVAIKTKWLLLPRITFVSLIFLVLLYIAAPFRVSGGAFVDLRFIIMAGYLLFAGLQENPALAIRNKAVIMTSFAIAIGFRIAIVSNVWREQNHEIVLVKEAVDPIPAGSRVLVANVFPTDNEAYWRQVPTVRRIDGIFIDNYNLPALFLIEQRTFFQTLFTDPTQQPLSVRSAYEKSAVLSAEWGPPSYSLLITGLQTEEDRDHYPYLENWRSNFDYVLVINSGGMRNADNFMRSSLELLEFNDLAALFRVRPLGSSH